MAASTTLEESRAESSARFAQQVRVVVLPGGRDGCGRVDRKNAARALGRSTKTMAEWSRLGRGPKNYLVGGRRYYDWTDVQHYATGSREAA